MTQPLSSETIALIRATTPYLTPHCSSIYTRVHERLRVAQALERVLESGSVAPGGCDQPWAAQESGGGGDAQEDTPSVLATAIMTCTHNLEYLEELEEPALQASLVPPGVRGPSVQHCDRVERALIQVIGEVLGDRASAPVLEAWRALFRRIGALVIAKT